MTPAALELHNLVMHAEGRCVLAVERLWAAPGCLLALMGPNGAGKTTLLRMLLGLARPARGTVAVLGEEVTALRGGRLAALRGRIGYMPQLLPSRHELPLTVREVVAIGRTGRAGLLRRLSRADWSSVDGWIECLGIAHLAGRAFSDLSGGEQRKSLLARAMAQEPELLLLDEPTANLDLGWRERIVATIETLFQRTRVTVVLVCHELEVLPPSCREVILLEAGRVTARGSPETLWTDERVGQLYGTGLRVVHHERRHAVLPTGMPAGFQASGATPPEGGRNA